MAGFDLSYSTYRIGPTETLFVKTDRTEVDSCLVREVSKKEQILTGDATEMALAIMNL